MSDGTIETLDIGILLRLPRLDVVQGNSLRFGPFLQFTTDIFGTVVHPDHGWPAAPVDDLVQAADDALSRKGKVHLHAQPLAVEIVQNIQQPEWPAIFQAIRHEIHGPNHVRPIRYSQGIRFVPPQALAWLDPEVQLQLAVDAVYPFMVPAMPQAQVEKA
ncbi:hypothetical protein MEG_01124 [Bartonella tamiae Th307]|uniref:Uncharacterized protein n=1 Tax=Bartonella tamiae Th239 TaxID=1094558 RepID=J0R3Z0_9HYPH|nr:hypothetical protein ME5_00760 [Bartonella tamiae Th239]EJF93700.1 hypothetical protein MEG_01124 [Bartonella tamiae Th307]